MADIQGIPARLTEIFERARRESRTTNAVADSDGARAPRHAGLAAALVA